MRYLYRVQRATGILFKRKFEGLWVTAEGAVYDFNPDIHTFSGVIERSWKRVRSIDWGKRVPTSLGVWAVDEDCRMYLTREVYEPRLRPDVLGRRCAKWLETGTEPRPQAVVCDHDTGNEGFKEAFEQASGLTLILADKTDRDKGIQTLPARFDVVDGRPRIYTLPKTLDHPPNTSLQEAGLPTCWVDEITGYVWDEDQTHDETIDYNAHTIDMTRYCVCWIDTNIPIGGYKPFDYSGFRKLAGGDMRPRAR